MYLSTPPHLHTCLSTLSVYLSACSPAHLPSLHLAITCLPVSMYISTPPYLPPCFFTCLPTYLPAHLSTFFHFTFTLPVIIYLSVPPCLHTCLFTCLLISLPAPLPTCQPAFFFFVFISHLAPHEGFLRLHVLPPHLPIVVSLLPLTSLHHHHRQCHSHVLVFSFPFLAY